MSLLNLKLIFGRSYLHYYIYAKIYLKYETLLILTGGFQDRDIHGEVRKDIH